MAKHYETVFILNPVLSEDQVKEAVKKYEDHLVAKGATMVVTEDWGLKKLAYPIQNKKSGFYTLFQFSTEDSSIIERYETEFRRDEKVMRFLTVAMDKHAVSWAERRRAKLNIKANN
ncbi:MAG: 30S ribosomal protein S6 [Flavobacteriales bacterium]|nr:30S ribosomal protein S6 [Flavobacteriales bacterium]